MSKLQLIEQKLAAIDSAGFQNLCDVYLARREQELASINRTGSQYGKQKTVKGTPDTFFRLVDGSLRYVEYTTTEKGIVDKIKDDIDKCLDEKKTGIPPDEVNRIIICFNSRLGVEEEQEIHKHAKEKSVNIELIGKDWLALEIYSKHLILAKDLLGIPLDTGQILPLDVFINEYDNKGGQLATPLDNIFFHRVNELQSIQQNLSTSDLLIITGAAGVGKTKIALEAITNFREANSDYQAFAIAKKDVDIMDDLRIQLEVDKNYILLIDDANRQIINFRQILGLFRELRPGQIKLVITARDYIIGNILLECADYKYDLLTIPKFKDEEIVDILESDSFEIKHSAYQKKIVELADGNARLAIMGARLAKEKNQEFLYGTVSTLYDEYFQTFVKDFDTLEDKAVLKTLGIISFFFSIARDNKEFITELLSAFQLDYHEFNEAIDELEKRELVEVQYNIVRVSEQVTATYFFYKVFIKDKLLSFNSLLFTYFPKWSKRFFDTVIPANNTFGYNQVLSEINDTLTNYFDAAKGDEEKELAFISLFWFYKREETLVYFYAKIAALPNAANQVYSTDYERNDLVYDKDVIIKQLSEFFLHRTESFRPALELAFAYCQKKPLALPELIRRIREKIVFEHEDEASGFTRQRDLFELLTTKAILTDTPYPQAFFALAQTFLKHEFNVTKGARNHSMTWYDYILPTTEEIKNLRKNIWETLFSLFDSYPEQVLIVLESFSPGIRGVNKELLLFDLSYIVPFVEARLERSLFRHIHFIHELVRWLNREDLPDKSYQQLKKLFISDEYVMFRKLEWNRLRGKEDYEFENNDEFEKLKEQDLKQTFIFQTENDFEPFVKALHSGISANNHSEWSLIRSVDVILEETFHRDQELAIALLKRLLGDYPLGNHFPHKTIRAVISFSDEYAAKLWNIIAQSDITGRIFLQFAFFAHLPLHLANEDYAEKLITTMKSISQGIMIDFEIFSKFLPIRPNIVMEAATIMTEKNDAGQLRISVWDDFYVKFGVHFNSNPQLLEKIYLQQDAINHHYDYSKNGLKSLIRATPSFLLEYIKKFKDRDHHDIDNKHISLAFVWDLVDAKTIEAAIDFLIDGSYYLGILEHPVVIFFNQMKDDQIKSAHTFLLDYIGKNRNNKLRLNIVFDTIRHSLNDFFDAALLHYISMNLDVEQFKEIDWVGNVGVVSGDVIFGELNAKRWQKVAEILIKAPDQFAAIPLKAYVKERIDEELRRAEFERKRKFLNPDW